jgi:hypothetical protein
MRIRAHAFKFWRMRKAFEWMPPWNATGCDNRKIKAGIFEASLTYRRTRWKNTRPICANSNGASDILIKNIQGVRKILAG